MVDLNWQLDGAYIDGAPTALQTAHIFGQARVDDADALLHCSFNMVEGDRGALVDRLIAGSPVVNEKYFRFPPGAAILGQWQETEAWSRYVFGRSADTDIGSVAADRAGMVGNWRQGETTKRGSSFYALTNSAYRMQTYDTAGALTTHVLNVPTNTMDLFRLTSHHRYLDGATWKTRAINHTGDSGSVSGGNTPPPTNMATTPAIGTYPLAIGYPGGTWTKHVDLRIVLCFPTAHGPADPESADITATVSLMRALIAQSGLTEGAA